jgi:hypothetical protein
MSRLQSRHKHISLRRRYAVHLRFIFVVAAIGLCPAISSAQARLTGAGLSGAVSDPSGALVPVLSGVQTQTRGGIVLILGQSARIDSPLAPVAGDEAVIVAFIDGFRMWGTR